MSDPFQPDPLQTHLLTNPNQQRPVHHARGKRTNPGEIVEVQGGHIVRSTGLKDRHSKVCTAKGPRDRRVRLSAHTAIQFYDVQDRLGYDRPSKAVDWLMKNAKSAIDELAELPPWQPTATTAPLQTSNPNNQFVAGASSSYLPDSLHSDSIADTIKSFFPIPSSNAGASDLRLSLQSFQDPIYSNQTNVPHANPNQIYPGFGSWSEYNVGGYGNGQFYDSQRGPLQSSSTSSQPYVRAWVDNPIPDNPSYTIMHPSQVQSIGLVPGNNRFSGFRIPARIQGEEEHDHGVPDHKPSSPSSE